VVSSTDAALDYLDSLQKKFNGDWQLALAAYNVGWGTVQNAIRKNKAAGKPTDYWSLPLPKTAQDYIPRILAIREVIQNPRKFNASLYSVADQPYFVQVPINRQLPLSQAAAWAKIPIAEITSLNPGFLHSTTTPNTCPKILIPTSKSTLFHNNMLSNAPVPSMVEVVTAATEPKNSQSDKVEHKVKQGDSLWGISRLYRVSIKQIAEWNNISNKSSIKPGQRLVIWQGSSNKNG
jgi:membrane-bound lytic murein transglycosylase D